MSESLLSYAVELDQPVILLRISPSLFIRNIDMSCCHLHLFPGIFKKNIFSFDFFYDRLFIQWIPVQTYQFLCVCIFPRVCQVVAFHLHSIVVRKVAWYDFNVLNLLRMIYGLKYSLSLKKKSHRVMKECVLQWWGEMFCRQRPGSFSPQCR